MDFLADTIKLATPALITLALAAQLVILLYVAKYFARRYPTYKRGLYTGSLSLFVLSLYPYYHFAYPGESFTFFLKSLIAIPLIFFLPGHLAYNAFIKEKADLGLVEILFIQAMGSVLLSGWIGLALAEVGFFSITNLSAILLLTCCIIKFKYNVKFDLKSFPEARVDKHTVFLIIILVISIALFFHPYPWVLGNLDQGTYLNTGVNIAKTGSIVVHDDVSGNLDDGLIGKVFYVFYHSHDAQYPGFYIDRNEPGRVIPQFFYLWPTWIAIFYSIFDLGAGFYVTPAFALLSVLGIYFAGKTLFNKNVGLVASLLLTINFAQVWYAREPMSEMLTMLLIFSGIALFILFIRQPARRYFGILSALCIGQVFLTRIDTVYLIIPFMLYLGYLWFYGRLKKDHWYFIIPLALIVTHAALTAVFISWPYTFSIYKNNFYGLYALISAHTYATVAGLAVFLVLLAIMAKHKSLLIAQARHLDKYTPYVKIMVALLLLLGVLFAYFIRPSGDIDSDSYNLVKLSWYMAGLFGVLFATAGFVLIMYKKPFNEAFIFLSIFLIYAVFYVISAKIDVWQPWWIRRYLPIVIPSAILCIAYLIDWIKGLNIKIPGIKANISGYISIFLVVFLVGSFMASDYRSLNFTQYGNAMEDVDHISKLVGSGSIILYKSNQFTEMIAVPLRYIYGHDVVSAYITNESIDQIKQWLNENKTVCLLGFDGFCEDDNGGGHIVKYAVNWPVLQDVYWSGRLSIYMPGRPRIDHFTYTFHILNNTSDLDGLALLYFNDRGWSDIEAWDKAPTIWGVDNASMTIYSMDDMSANLTFDVKSYDINKTLQVYLNEYDACDSNITRDYRRVNLPVELKKGYNVVVFRSKEGCPNNKSRSIACQDVMLEY